MYDYLIRGAQVLDGSGKKAVTADVAVSGTKIAEIAPKLQVQARETIDGRGKYLTPGFIDVHRHGDAAAFRKEYGKAELAQGLTSVINGNCGLSMTPIQGEHKEEILSYLKPVVGELPKGCDFSTLRVYREQLSNVPQRIHNGMLVGMGTIRGCAAGFASNLTVEEYATIHRLLEEALSDGALGVSLGLGYAPECFYDTKGLIRSLEPLRNSGKLITVHMRQEGDEVIEALQEMICVAKELHTPVEISHLKAIGTRNWTRCVPQMIKMIRKAREQGVDITCDVYPYPAGSTQLIHTLPPEFQVGGLKTLIRALKDPKSRADMKIRMKKGTDFENLTSLVGFDHIQATSLVSESYRPFEGMSIREIAEKQEKDPYDTLFDLLAEEHCTPAMVDWITSEADIDLILKQPWSSVISDATYPVNGLMHPRVYGNIPHLLEYYVKQRGLLTVEEAVHKVTGLPAERFGLKQKGRIASEMDADLCLFDLKQVHQTGTWQNPAQLAVGMDTVFVMGKPARYRGEFTDHFGGGVL